MSRIFFFACIFLSYFFLLWISGGYEQRDENTYNSIAFNIAQFDQYNSSRGVDTNDLSKNYFWPRILQAPGYFIILGYVQKLVGNAYLAIILYYSVLHLILFVVLYKSVGIVAPDFQWKWYHIPLILLFPPVLYGNGNDFTSTVFFFSGCYLSLKLIITEQDSWLKLIPISLVIFVCAFSRYAYYPLIFVIPVSLFLTGTITNRKRITRYGIIQGTTLAVLLTGQYLILNNVLGRGLFLSTSYAIPNDRMFYWENILRFDPFPIKSLFFLGHTAHYVQYGTAIKVLLVLLSALILGIVFYYFYKKQWYGLAKLLKKGEHLSQPPALVFFQLVGFLLLMVNVAMLVSLSLLEPHQPLYGFWTYVLATRYYMPNMIYVVLWICILLPSDKVALSGLISRTVKAIGSLVFLGAFLIMPLIYYGKITDYFVHENRHRQNIEVYEYARKLMKENKTVLYSDEVAYNVYFVTLSGAIPFYTPASHKNNLQWNNYYYDLISNKVDFSYSRPLTLLMKINHYKLGEAKEFLDHYEAKTVMSFGNSTLFQVEFNNPQTK